jgi:hypothetical protein
MLGVGDGKAILDELALPQKANTIIYPGALVVVNAGYAAPGTAATGLLAAGCADQDCINQPSDSTGLADGAITIRVKQGVFAFDNSTAGDAITQALVGRNCYIVDDHTVAKTSNGSTRSVAGVIVAIDALDGVYVSLCLQISGQDTT